MNSGNDQAGQAQAARKQLPAPAPAGAPRDQAHVAALLQAIASEISQSDQRQSHALADLRTRLDLMTERQAGADAPAAEPAAKPELTPRKTAIALPDLRAPAAEPVAAPVSVQAEPAVPVAARPAVKPQQTAPAAPNLGDIYAAVAKSYSEAASQRGSVKPGAARPLPPLRSALAPPPAIEADDASDEFMDMSALAEPQPVRAVKARIAPPVAAEAALPRPPVEVSFAVEKSINDLARRVAETEKKVDGVAVKSESAEAVLGINAHIDALRAELEKLTSQHEKISVEVGQVSANVKSLSEAAGRIGPMGDSLEHLNEAILALRQDMPGYAVEAAERAGTHAASVLSHANGNAELAEKLSIVQNLLLSQFRENQEADGRSYGAIESIRGLVQNLHNRIDELETQEPPPPAQTLAAQTLAPQTMAEQMAAKLSPPAARAQPQAARFAAQIHQEPEFAEDETLVEAGADEPPHPEAAPAMSREQLIASARRAAINASQKPRLAGIAAAGGGSALQSLAAKANSMTSRPILSVAMVALLAAGLGIAVVKVTHKSSPAISIERAALPDIPDDPADAAVAGKPAKDASKPAASAAKAAPDKPAPGKVSALTADDQGMTAANAGELPPAAPAKPVVTASLDPVATTGALPAAIAPLSMRSAAEAGDPIASFTVAERFLAGKDVPRDAIKARHWYEQSAKAGYPLAEFHLGLMLEKGEDGVAADRALAQAWYRKGAEHGNVQAMHNLAVLYTAQSGGTPDYAAAAKWFGEAASYGLKDSQFNLAVLYQSGMGVPKDAGAAYKWFAIGGAHGDTEAAKQRDELQKTLAAPALVAAEAQVKAWHQKLIDHRANVGEVPGVASIAPDAAHAMSSASTQIGDVQKMLAKLGYDPGTQDGALSAQTREAIKTFEQRSGLKADGEISDELIGKLKALAG